VWGEGVDDDGGGKKQMAQRIVNVKHTHTHSHRLLRELPSGGSWIAGSWCIGKEAKGRESKFFGAQFILFYLVDFKYTSHYVAEKN